MLQSMFDLATLLRSVDEKARREENEACAKVSNDFPDHFTQRDGQELTFGEKIAELIRSRHPAREGA